MRRFDSGRGRLRGDHVRPLALGGADTDWNVQVLCRGCHRLKDETELGAGWFAAKRQRPRSSALRRKEWLSRKYSG
ncbi:HNH endonuclease [Streptomyces natalensis]|uniref:HNH endonuclease n=1 Tax=Streptomyces natalensis TaxID=68242 RepID=UPI00099B5FA7|nr:HNH endonuclease signature motif containing protein [Streptomyces natalensis]